MAGKSDRDAYDKNGGLMEHNEDKYNDGGRFEAIIGRTKYEVVMKFREDGLSMQEKALRVVRECVEKEALRT